VQLGKPERFALVPVMGPLVGASLAGLFVRAVHF